MLRHTLHTAARTLQRRSGFTALNVLGLAAGMACCLLIGLWVHQETTFDAFHPEADRIHRVALHYTLSADHPGSTYTLTPLPLAEALEREVASVERAVRATKTSHVVRRGDRSFSEEAFYRADAGFFDLFGFPLRHGDPSRVLEPARAVVLTEAAAKRYFPAQDNPVGQTLHVGETAHTVTGVAADLPANTHFDFDVVASLPPNGDPSWFRNRVVTYVRLADGTAPETLHPSLRSLIVERKRAADDPERDYALYLQPITGVHLGTGLPAGVTLTERPIPGTFGGTGRLAYVYLFSGLAVFVLLIAGANFVNLATARAADRAVDVGARKALGAGRATLTAQFLAESVLMSGAALVIALGLTQIALPFLNGWTGTALHMAPLWTASGAVLLLGSTLAVGGLAGAYPSLVLSRLAPATALRGTAQQAGGQRLRQTLVVGQFAIAVALIASTVIVGQQLDYMQSKDLGFDTERTLLLDINDDLLGRNRPDLPKQALRNVPGVAHVARANGVPGESFGYSAYRPVTEQGPGDRVDLHVAWGDYDYTDALGISVAQGRGFSRARPSDSSAVLINQAAARQLFGTADPIGKQITTTGPRERVRTVVGVIEDVNYQSLRQDIAPMAVFFLEFPASWPDPRTMVVRLRSGEGAATLDAIEQTWAEALPYAPLEYAFLNDRLDAQYRADMRLATMFALFAGLAIVIACVGLLGLSAYAARQRRKEIGIRKAVGASVASIVRLLSTDFLRWVGVAVVLAAPVAYVAMQRWLSDFAYRVDLGVWPFVASAGMAGGVALATVSTQALRASRINPADTLRSE